LHCFADISALYGFRASAFIPVDGLVETMLLVTAATVQAGDRTAMTPRLDKEALANHRVTEVVIAAAAAAATTAADDDIVSLVSVGCTPGDLYEIVIADFLPAAG
jgi:hypothetical protein